MSQAKVRKLLFRAIEDPVFRSSLFLNSEDVLSSHELTADEQEALASIPAHYISLLAGEKRSPIKEVRKTYNFAQQKSSAEVLLISMPFASANQPSAALGLLKSSLLKQDIHAHTRYLILDFAKLVGVEEYQRFYMKAPKSSLIHEWVFSGALFTDYSDKQADYIRLLAARNPRDDDLEWILEEVVRLRGYVPMFLNNWLNENDWRSYRIIGFSMTYQQVTASLALAKLIKELDPKKVIVLGGACCNGEMGIEMHRQFPFIDYIFTGESELIFPGFVSKILQDKPIEEMPGVIRRCCGATALPKNLCVLNRELDSLPYPDYAEYFEQLGKLDLADQIIPRVSVETSRGCWWGERSHCTFCGYNSLGIVFRSKSADRALAEILYLKNMFDCPIEATDSILNNSYFDYFLPVMAKTDLDINLFFETRATLSKKELELLQKAGVWRIQPGIESLSTNILRIMRKGTTALKNIRLLKYCAEFGISCNWLFLFGLPGEDKAEYRRMAEIIPAIIHLEPPIRCQKIRLERFSPFFNDPTKYRLVNINPVEAYNYIYPFSLDVLEKIAYYFDFEYADGRCLDYVDQLTQAVDEWQQREPYYRLDMISRGEKLYIWDLRPHSTDVLTVLSGVKRKVYEMCAEIIHIQNIIKNLDFITTNREPEFSLDDFLQEMCEKRLMLREGNKFIGLAVKYDSNSSSHC